MTDTPTTTPDTNLNEPVAAPMVPPNMPADATTKPADPNVEANACASDDKKAADPAQPKT
jgi:hypothetical protein